MRTKYPFLCGLAICLAAAGAFAQQSDRRQQSELPKAARLELSDIRTEKFQRKNHG